jgi:nicotinamide riboside transporter PnuC
MTFIAIIGTILNIRKMKLGFFFWTISNGFWAIHNVLIEEYAQAILYLVFLVLAVWGFFSWNSKSNLNVPL